MRQLLFCAMLLLGCTGAESAVVPQITHAWIRSLPGDLPAAGYATVVNPTARVIRLTGADCAEFGMVMLHRSIRRNGVEQMHSVDGIDIPAHGEIRLAPGGYHLMLMHAKKTVHPGDHVRIDLQFSGNRTMPVDFIVRPANANSDHD